MIWVAVGGRGTLVGAILGAVLVNAGKTYFTGALPELWLFALGFLFILVTLLLPHGILGAVRAPCAKARGSHCRNGTHRAGARRMTTIGADSDTLLYLDGVSVSFDGFKALNKLSLVLAPGEMRAVIGPNGAGKTTMMDVITGKTRPDDGTRGVRRRHRPHHARRTGHRGARHRPEIPEADRVRAAHRVGQPAARARGRPAAALHACGRARPRTSATASRAILKTIRLGEQRHRRAGDLSHGQKQWLEIGMLLAQEPQLLLVDEPVAGMTDAETEQTAELLREINRTRSVVVVEHDMAFVRALGVKVTVLHEGSVLSEGIDRPRQRRPAGHRSVPGTLRER